VDKIRLVNIELYGYHGLRDEEREIGGKFAIDVEIGLDLRKAGETDSINHTVDYRRIYEIVKEVVMGKSFKLIESIAHSIAEAVMEELDVEYAKIRVRKLSPPIDGLVDYAEVEVERGRDEPT
jgi:dihydroneopterin aldolase